MGIIDKIQHDLHEAMKKKEKEKINTLRNIVGTLKYKVIEKGEGITEQEEIKVIQSLAKQRKDSIEMYKKGERSDLVEIESTELSIINEYLPQAMSEEEVKSLVKDSVEESGAQSIADLGKIMPIIMKKGAGRVNGKLAQQILREILSE
tara:strand:- start:334 stop:780 length:447 start_codon:yes stop_codon:yes gene_type:complete